jgi:cytoskeleton protein RodZ
LQRERERRSLSVIEAAEKLHLDPSVVDALESNRFAAVGPAVFAKGHLKQYAALLDLPASEIMASYEAVLRVAPVGAPLTSGSDSAGDALATPFPKMPSLQQLPLLAKLPALSVPVGIALVTLLLGATAVLWWKPWQNHATQAALNSQGVAMSPSAPTEVDSGVPTDVPAAPTATGTVAPDAAQSPSVAGTMSPLAGRVRLRRSFSADSWVDVHDASGATVYRGKGAANSVKTVAGAAPLSVYLGYVSGVQLEINSHAVAIGPQFVRGDVARFEAGADGVLRRTARP